MTWRRRAPAALLGAVASLATVAVRGGGDEPKAQAIAIVVNAKNETADLSLEDLRKLLLLEKQFWPDGERVSLFLRPNGSREKDVLLRAVYRMDAEALKKHWTAAVFAGRIPSIPPVVRSPEAAVASVRQSRGGISAVTSSSLATIASRSLAEIRVVTIDGKAPGHPEYALTSSDR